MRRRKFIKCLLALPAIAAGVLSAKPEPKEIICGPYDFGEPKDRTVFMMGGNRAGKSWMLNHKYIEKIRAQDGKNSIQMWKFTRGFAKYNA